MNRRDRAAGMAPATMVWFFLHTTTGRLTGAGIVLLAVAVGLVLGITDASQPVALVASVLLGVAVAAVSSTLAMREERRRGGE